MPEPKPIEVRDAVLPQDAEAVRRLWLDYLTWPTGDGGAPWRPSALAA